MIDLCVIGTSAALRDLTGRIPLFYAYPDCVVYRGELSGGLYTMVVDREEGLIDLTIVGHVPDATYTDLLYTALSIFAPEALDYTLDA